MQLHISTSLLHRGLYPNILKIFSFSRASNQIRVTIKKGDPFVVIDLGVALFGIFYVRLGITSCRPCHPYRWPAWQEPDSLLSSRLSRTRW